MKLHNPLKFRLFQYYVAFDRQERVLLSINAVTTECKSSRRNIHDEDNENQTNETNLAKENNRHT